MPRPSNGDATPIRTQAAVENSLQAEQETATRLVAELASPPAGFEVDPPTFTPHPPGEKGSVDKLIAQAEREGLLAARKHQAAQREEMDRARREGRRPRPVLAEGFLLNQDTPLTLDKDGKPCGSPDTHKHLVSMFDADGKESNRKIAEFKREGYVPVHSRVDGQPLSANKCLVMEAPPRVVGLRRARHGQHLQASDAQSDAAFAGGLEDINRAIGKTAIRPFVVGEHNAGETQRG